VKDTTRSSYVEEATDLDNVCIESLSIDLTRPMLDAAARSVDKLADKIDEQVPSEFLRCG
jgi:DNA excision repair protein ERCC-2